VDRDLIAQLDEALDAVHFTRRAAAGEVLAAGSQNGFLHGRARELDALRRWTMGRGQAVTVLTGKPGVGKSALLGILVWAIHPGLRDQTKHLWRRTGVTPPKAPPDRLAGRARPRADRPGHLLLDRSTVATRCGWNDRRHVDGPDRRT
jgi:hypothetical protein